MSLATHAPRKRGDTRTRMLVSAAEVMRERGAAGVTIDEVLTRSGAPRGSVYYHFPDGRNQILAEALQFAGDAITADIDAAACRGAKVLLREFVDFWERVLADSDFNAGDYVFVAELYTARVDVYDARSGQLVGTLTPGPEVGGTGGWVDVYLGIAASRRANGEYVVLVEDDARAKLLMYRWTP